MRDLKLETMLLIVRAINAWLWATEHRAFIRAEDITVIERDNRFMLAFELIDLEAK